MGPEILESAQEDHFRMMVIGAGNGLPHDS